MPGSVSLKRAVGSQAVDQSQTRNKRNDRLAEGHERVAGAIMVLRMEEYTAPPPSKCHGISLGNHLVCARNRPYGQHLLLSASRILCKNLSAQEHLTVGI